MVLISELHPLVIQTVRKLILNDEALRDYMTKFNQEIDKGLNAETCETASVKSFITHVNKLPTGNEEGNFIALEFGSTTIRILLVSMQERECTVTCKTYDVPEKLMAGPSKKLFDFLARCIADFLKGLKLNMLRVPLGFTFGFPIDQRSLQDCRLVRWTKGFQCDDLIGKDVCSKLKDSIRNYPELKRIYVIGVLNDTVSAVLACAWQDPSCKIGVVVGPGANCCYAEKVCRISKYEPVTSVKDIYINLESGALGEDGCLDELRSDFDFKLDESSSNKGQQINEKMLSMVYLGELTRLCLVACVKQNLFLEGRLSEKIMKNYSFETAHMSRIESDAEGDYTECRAVLAQFGYSESTEQDCIQVQFICRCVSRRAANLMACQIATLINRIGDDKVTVAADGQMIKEYPNFEWYLTKKLKQLKKSNYSFQIIKTEENGLGRGAAVMAAVFGQEVMDKEEKLRRLPGFPMDQCHFRKKGKCQNPDCNAKHPCDSNEKPITDPVLTPSQEVIISSCLPKTTEATAKSKKNPCDGYVQS